jgi:mannose-6-phosphate isomerase
MTRSLLELVERDPERELGAAVVAHFGSRLPFLFKVLAAEQPLSLQAHPDSAQARTGFEQEERAGIAQGAPERNYKDASHKPELVCALTPFHALCGFRDLEKTRTLFELLGVDALIARARRMGDRPAHETLRALFLWLLSLAGGERAELLSATVAACRRHRDGGGDFAHECDWAVRIAALYPTDAGVVLALLLNWICLEPGEALYLPAGRLHAYLGGVALEIMANSDNVLRAGLTPKHVDVPELTRILQFTDGPVLAERPLAYGSQQIYSTPSPEFRLSRVDLSETAPFRALRRAGPEIILCLGGGVRARSGAGVETKLDRGQSAFVPAADGPYDLRGQGTVFRAEVGLQE